MRTLKKKPKAAPRTGAGAPTINDVARAAGVSTMTVSRVINRMGNVKAQTMVAVDAAISRLHYAPNPAARSLAGARQIRIGLLCGSPGAAWLSELLIGLLEQANRSHAQLVIEPCAADGDILQSAKKLADDAMDALILPPPLADSKPLLEWLQKSATPCVFLGSLAPSKRASSVGIDEEAAARAMTMHLLDQGHHRIGFIAGDPARASSARRQRGYEQALQARGLKVVSELIESGLCTYRSGLDAAERLLRLPMPPTAIFASDDDMAAAAVAMAHSQGIAVPSDLAVCGFGDSLMATTIWPALTTVRQPIGRMAQLALENLVEAVKAQRAGQAFVPRHDSVEYTLVRRHSDAAPRRRPPATQLRQA